jgi:hypothetical protein
MLAPVATTLAPETSQAALPTGERPDQRGGAEGTRTPDPHTASVVRYQLRHSPLPTRSGVSEPSTTIQSPRRTPGGGSLTWDRVSATAQPAAPKALSRARLGAALPRGARPATAREHGRGDRAAGRARQLTGRTGARRRCRRARAGQQRRPRRGAPRLHDAGRQAGRPALARRGGPAPRLSRRPPRTAAGLAVPGEVGGGNARAAIRRTAVGSSARPGSSCRTGHGSRSRCRTAARSAPRAGPHRGP